MFDRAGLKTAAKRRIAQNRWMAVLVCLVAGFCGVFGGSVTPANFSNSFMSGLESGYESGGTVVSPDFGSSFDQLFSDQDVMIFIIIALVVAAVVFLAALAFQLFVVNIIRVGFFGWFLRYSRGENPEFSEMFSRFNHFKNTMLGMLLCNVYIFLWSLLLIIPGIIKSYAYSMVPYILYENPSMSAKQAIALSETMTDGWKWELFKFDLSFFGWFILDTLTCGLLSLFFVNPYYYTSHAMLYDNIKYDAVYTRGVINSSTLNMPLYPYTTEAEVAE